MSYLALFKEADARLRAAQPGNAVDALNAESHPADGDSRLNRVNRVPESSPTPVDLSEVARVLGLPLDQLDRELEVRVPWLDRPLWFVPDETAASVLLAEGISRGRIWTVYELCDLFTIPGLTKAGARTVAEAKLAIDGMVETVRNRKAASDERPCDDDSLPLKRSEQAAWLQEGSGSPRADDRVRARR
jgi:hypothetical protein